MSATKSKSAKAVPEVEPRAVTVYSSPDPGSAAVRAGQAGVAAADVAVADAAIAAELDARGAAVGDNARDRSIRAFIDANRVGSPGYNFVIAIAKKAGP